MATTTTNYGLLKPAGTDSYNHLVYDNPNMDTIDAAMKANSDAAVTSATCVKTGTTHTIVRTNTDAPVFRFTATGDWNQGDTMIVDGVTVSVFLPNGSAPLTGSYVINSEVIAIIQGSRVTIFVPATQTATETPYDNTTSGLTATDVQNAIDEVKGITDTIDSNLITEAAKIGRFIGNQTLGYEVGSVFTRSQFFPNETGMAYFASSNQPTNHPSWNDWGGYLFIKFTNTYGLVFSFSGTAFGYASWYNGTLATWNRIN